MREESKERFRLTEASGEFNEAIARGARAIRRREAARRRRGRYLAAAAAVVILIAGGLLAAHRLFAQRPEDRRVTALSQGTAGVEPSLTPPVSPTPTPEASAVPSPTPLPMAEESGISVTPDVGPTPSPTPMPAPGMAVAGGELLCPLEGHELAGDPPLWPETPELAHHVYAYQSSPVDPDAVAEALWQGAPCTRDDYDGIVVYTVQAKDNPYGAYKAKLYWHEEEQSFSYSPDDPARLAPELLRGENEPLDGLLKAGEWFKGWMDPEVMDSLIPFDAGAGYREGDAVDRYVDFSWLQRLEGSIGVDGFGLRGTYCSYGPWFFVLRVGTFEPVDDDGGDGAHAYLTSRQAVNALNEFHAIEGEDIDAFTNPEAKVLSIQPVFTNRFSEETDGLYRFAWALVLEEPERPGDTATVLVDGATGKVWNMHDGVLNTSYTPAESTTVATMGSDGSILSLLCRPALVRRKVMAGEG